MAGAKPAGFNLGYQIIEVIEVGHTRGTFLERAKMDEPPPMLIPGEVMEGKKIVVVDPGLGRLETLAGGKFLEFLHMVLI